MSKVTITNANAEALLVTKYRSVNSVVVPGKVGETDGSAEISTSPVQWFTEAEQKAHYENTYGTIPGITVSFSDQVEHTGSVSFKVVDATNTAVEGASIAVTGKDPVTTIANGTGAFTGLGAGTYEFTISKATFADTVVTVVLDTDSSEAYIQAVLVAA